MKHAGSSKPKSSEDCRLVVGDDGSRKQADIPAGIIVPIQTTESLMKSVVVF
jgi:hypothetical protein